MKGLQLITIKYIKRKVMFWSEQVKGKRHNFVEADVFTKVYAIIIWQYWDGKFQFTKNKRKIRSARLTRFTEIFFKKKSSLEMGKDWENLVWGLVHKLGNPRTEPWAQRHTLTELVWATSRWCQHHSQCTWCRLKGWQHGHCQWHAHVSRKCRVIKQKYCKIVNKK